MSLKPKTSRRLALAGVLLALAVASVVGLVFVRKWQKDRTAQRMRAEGIALYEKHAYAEAADRLRHWLTRNLSDAEGWRMLADCWDHDEQPDGGHMQRAVQAYERVLDIDPGDRASALKLLKLQNRVGLFQEALTLAARLRPARPAEAGPEHFEVLREEVVARAGLKQFDDRLGEITDRMIALRPEDFGANLARAGYLRENGRNAEALAHATAASAKFPDSRPLRLLKVLVQAQESGAADPAPLFEGACDAAGLDPRTGEPRGPAAVTDPEFVLRLVALFDSRERFAHSEGVLRSVLMVPGADPDLVRLAVRRMWQGGHAAAVVEQLRSIDTSTGGAHSDLLAFLALSLRDTGRAAEAAPAVAALRDRRDFRARVWSAAFEVDPSLNGGAPVQPVEVVRRLRAALKDVPPEPVVQLMLGQALGALGRSDEAREAWRLAAGAAPGWAAPLVEIARSYLDEGRADDALRAARTALGISPGGVGANSVYLIAQAASIEQGASLPPNAADLARRLEDAASQTAGVKNDAARRALLGGITPARVILAARSGRLEDARAIVRAVLSEAGEPDGALLRRLAIICAREKLGLEAECLARSEKAGIPGPAVALTRALTLNEAGRRAEGLSLLDKGAEAAPPAQRSEWLAAKAQFLDLVGDPGSLDAWKTVADANPENLTIQLAALRSPGSARELAFVDRLSERVNRLSNADDTRPLSVVRLARARALLAGPPTVKARDEAVSILRTLTLEPADGYEVRSVLVSALLMESPDAGVKPDLAGALEQLRAMRDSAPDKSVVSLQIASVLQRQREFARAKEELLAVATSADARPDVRYRAIDLLISQAGFAEAVGPFRALLESQGASAEPARWLRLASVCRALRQDAQAAAIYRQLAGSPPDDPEQIAQIADGLATDGRLDEARQVLARLETLSLAPGQRELILATFWDRRADIARASEYYEKAIAAAPQRAEPWVRYAQFRIARSEFDKATELVSRGLENVPGSAELRVVQQQVAVRRSDRGDVDLSQLVTAMQNDPAYKAKAEIVGAVEELRRQGRLDTAAGIAELRAKFPADMAVQTLAMRLLLRLSPPRLDLAAQAAKEALLAFPTSPEPARLATDVFRLRSEWPDMLKAAQAWQQLTRSAEADLAVAEAQVNLNQARAALDTIRPRFESALKDPDAPGAAEAIQLHCRALAMTGRAAEALELLRPMLKTSATVRSRVAIPLAALYIQPDSDGASWLQEIGPMVPEDDADGRIVLASAWATLAARAKPPRDDYFDLALASVKPLTAGKGPEAVRAHETSALILRQRKDATGAAEAYRRALAIDPQRAPTMLALAELLVASGGDSGEAVRVAENAAQAAGGRGASAQRVLGRALGYHAGRLQASGRRDEARAAYQRASQVFKALITADPTDAASHVGIAEVSEALGDLPAAVVSYDKALQTGLLAPADKAAVQNNLAYALLRSDSSPVSLDRARGLVIQAISTAEVGAFVDTLGAIEAARGDRTGAIKAYGRALEIDPTMQGTRIELAAALAGGTAEQRARASALLDEAAKSAALSPEQKKRLDEVRRLLATPK